MNQVLLEVFKAYGFDKDQYVGTKVISAGHINSTEVLYFDLGNRVKRYLLQEINTYVFKEPEKLMDNISNVTTYGKDLLKSFEVPNYHNRIMRVFETLDGKSFFKTSSGRYFRIYHYIEGGISIDSSTDEKIFEAAGKAIGFFQNMLSNYPIDKLYTSIPNFHNTPKRYEDFLKVLEKAPEDIKQTCLEEIEFYKANKDIAYSIQPLLDKGLMPTRVTHNDTKLNNVFFNYDTHDGLCLVDLDTVMPGSICYDFGDFVRSGCNMGLEDDQNLENVVFNDNLFIKFANGYIKAVGRTLTELEISNLTMGAILMTYECGMRFLADYLDGNKYFKTNYPTHNLVRTRTQISMVKQLLAKKEMLDKAILEMYQNI